MCLNPRWIYKKGFYKESNYRGYKGQAYELGTYAKCGHCETCIAEKANNWVIRNYYEEKKHIKKCFITLTYQNNPIILVKKDLQDFIKRLRAKIKEKIRIFYAGEYGEINNRPHYHIIIYGWEDKKIEYLNINKKGNILYKSEIIEKTWGLGRTSYQKFNENEIPYIALYNTAKETFKRAYILNRKNLNYLEKYAYNHKNLKENQRRNLIKEINEKRKQVEIDKKKYLTIKEFNGWSIALGWEEFEKNYSEEYVFNEYIQDKQFITPTPWVKKLANKGSENAKKEMFKREEEIKQESNEKEEITKNINKLFERRKEEKIENAKDRKDEIEF